MHGKILTFVKENKKKCKKAKYMESFWKGYNGDGVWYFLAHSNLFCWTVLLKPFQMFNLKIFSLYLVGNFRLKSKNNNEIIFYNTSVCDDYIRKTDMRLYPLCFIYACVRNSISHANIVQSYIYTTTMTKLLSQSVDQVIYNGIICKQVGWDFIFRALVFMRKEMQLLKNDNLFVQ